ncbi:MAG: manganese efflux pump [Clostridia bacterium]|nr:manganese efflux pump [Clostridia bacterium]
MDYFYIVVTVLAVSVDCFFAGFSVKDKSLFFPCLAGIVTFFICLASMCLGKLLASVLPNIKYIGCALLALVGAFNILKKDDGEITVKSANSNWLSFALAVGVATDGALAAFSFAFLGYVSVWIVLGMSAAHFVFSGLGVLFSKKIAKMQEFNIISGIMLIFLAVLKLLN